MVTYCAGRNTGVSMVWRPMIAGTKPMPPWEEDGKFGTMEEARSHCQKLNGGWWNDKFCKVKEAIGKIFGRKGI
jgi:hypothetical protein